MGTELIEDGYGLSFHESVPFHELKVPVSFILKTYKELGFAVDPDVERRVIKAGSQIYVSMSDLLKSYCSQLTEPIEVSQQDKENLRTRYEIDVDQENKTLTLKESKHTIKQQYDNPHHTM
ncbi:hypothetical protein HZA99_06935 [Candidatus Woesearchaeota archaeon]|nr:hypothetical protein [Candidatus Woesearchaeota archaeon]